MGASSQWGPHPKLVHLTREGLTTPPISLSRRPQLTIICTPDGKVTADYIRASNISIGIMETLRKESVGYAALGCALALARLSNPDERLSAQREIQFVSDVMEYVGTWFAIPEGSEGN